MARTTQRWGGGFDFVRSETIEPLRMGYGQFEYDQATDRYVPIPNAVGNLALQGATYNPDEPHETLGYGD